MYFISFTKISMYIFRIYCFWKDKNGAKKGKVANCSRRSRFSPIKSVYLQTLSKYHPKIVRRKRKGQETRLGFIPISAFYSHFSVVAFYPHRQVLLHFCDELDTGFRHISAALRKLSKFTYL